MTLVEISDTLRSLWGLWLMVVFVGIVWWAFRPGNRARFEDCASIPLRDDKIEER